MTLIAIIDFETTGLDENTSEITELGGVLWEAETKTIVDLYSKLIKIESEVPERIVKLTGLTNELLNDYGHNKELCFNEFNSFLERADYICAHNTSFEKKFYNKHFNNIVDKHWIDSRTDLPEEAYVHSSKLQYLSADNGFLNPFSHRAVFDCLTVVKLLEKFNFDKILEKSLEPVISIVANVSYDDRQLAKDAGFYWNKDEKVWQMEAKKSDLKGKKFPFKVEVL